jgi:hypothetical protein
MNDLCPGVLHHCPLLKLKLHTMTTEPHLSHLPTQVYISAIKALRHLDPSGVTLEAVSHPVRTYLKARLDTIRQIVTSLTDPETSELLEPASNAGGDEHLRGEGGTDAELADVDPDEVLGDEVAMLKWLPDPMQVSFCLNMPGARAQR